MLSKSAPLSGRSVRRAVSRQKGCVMWGSLKLRAIRGARSVRRSAAVVGGSALALVGQAQAAVPIAVTDALDDMGADGISVATVVLVAIVGVFAFKFMRKGL